MEINGFLLAHMRFKSQSSDEYEHREICSLFSAELEGDGIVCSRL